MEHEVKPLFLGKKYEQSTGLKFLKKAIAINDEDKPVMHTFFEDVEGGCCGMTEEGHREMLDVWEQSWQARGWRTRILKLKDAQRHPFFEAFNKYLESRSPRHYIDKYNRYCFFRWFAMASLPKGGWMSDYDTIPLHFGAEEAMKLSEDGTFNTFSRHVPCLIHASRNEWDRVLHLMVNLMKEKPDRARSDMLALQMIHSDTKQSGTMIWHLATIDKFPYKTDSKSGEKIVNCNIIMKMSLKALHLSHKGIESSWAEELFPMDRKEIPSYAMAVEKRGRAAAAFAKDYESECMMN